MKVPWWNPRVLELDTSGWFYLILCILVGVLALFTGNNVLYFMESLLLSGLIYSGITSERLLQKVDLEVQRAQAVEGIEVQDACVLENHSSQYFFSLRVLEWRADGRFFEMAYFPVLKPKERRVVYSKQHYEKRGSLKILGYAIQTDYPYGLAKKMKCIEECSTRLVWPHPENVKDLSAFLEKTDYRNDEKIKNYEWGGSIRNIVWKLSDRGQGWVEKHEDALSNKLEVYVVPPGFLMDEGLIRTLSFFLLKRKEVEVKIFDRNEKKTILGHQEKMDYLSNYEVTT